MPKKISHQFHSNLTPISTYFYTFTLTKGRTLENKEVMIMFFGLDWYWWIVFLILLAVSVPFKIRFMRWWYDRQQKQKKERHEKWGDDE